MKNQKIIFPLIFAVYLACFLWVGNYGAFWSEDAGVKYLQMINFTRSNWNDSAIAYPGEDIDPGLKFNPLSGNHTLIKNKRIYSIYPLPFAFLSSLIYKLLGFPGLYLLPLLSTFLLLIIVYKLASQLWERLPAAIIGAGSPSHKQLLGYQYCKTSPQDRNSAFAITLITAFCTPLFFYAFTFWEINIAALLSIGGLYIFLKGKSQASRQNIILGGILLGSGIFFREESVIFLLSLIVVQFTFRRNIRNGLLLALGALIPVLGFILLGYLSEVGGLTHLLHNISTRPRNFGSFSSFLDYKWKLIYQLLLSGNQNLLLNIFFITPSILFILFTLINKNKRGTKNDSISLILLSTVLGSYLCYSVLLLTSKYPIRLTPFTNGLLIFSPWILFGFRLPGKKRKNIFAELFRLAGIFILLVCLTVPTSGGLQWGPRYLVLIYPILVIISYSSFISWLDKIRFKKWLTFIFTSLILLGTLNEVYGLHLLKEKKRFNRELLEKLNESEAGIIITLPWWIPLNTTSVFYDKTLLAARGPQKLSNLIELLKERHQTRFVLITHNDPAIIDLIAKHFHLFPDKIEEVKLPGDDYFQVKLLNYRF